MIDSASQLCQTTVLQPSRFPAAAMSQALPNSSKSRARVRPHSCVHCQAIRPKKPERLYYTPGDSAALKKPLEYFSFYIYEFIRLNVSYADLQNWPADNCEFARYVCQRLVEEGTPEGVDPAAIHFFLELRSGKVRFLSGMIHLQSVRDMQGPCKSWMVPPEEERGLCYVYAVAVGCCLTVGEGMCSSLPLGWSVWRVVLRK